MGPAGGVAAARLSWLGQARCGTPRGCGTTSDLRAGRLVRVLPEYTVGDGNVCLVHPAAKVLPAKARVFRDFLLANIELLTQGAECVEHKAQHARASAGRTEGRWRRAARPAG